MIDMASKTCVAVIYYRKGVTNATAPPRLVEPYSFADGKQDLMIRCYQLEKDGDGGESGWRFFMSHKLERVEPTTIQFRPRRKITLPTGEVNVVAAQSPHWELDGRRVYRDLVVEALADGSLNARELFDLEHVKQTYRLTADDIRYVHASVYHRCLGSVLEDGFFAAEEGDQIRFLHRAMKALGWSVGE